MPDDRRSAYLGSRIANAWRLSARVIAPQAIRSLRRSPGFVVTACLTLALAIGANAAMFAVIDRLLFRTPPFLRNPETVRRVYLARSADGKESLDGTLDYQRYLELARAAPIVNAVPVASVRRGVGVGPDTREVPVEGAGASLLAALRRASDDWALLLAARRRYSHRHCRCRAGLRVLAKRLR